MLKNVSSTKSISEDIPVTVDVEIDSILEIVEGKNTMKIKFKLIAMWIDEFVTYINLNKEKNTSLSLEQKMALWTPEMVFDNTVDKHRTHFEDTRSDAFIILNNNATPGYSDLNHAHNWKSFNGKDG